MRWWIAPAAAVALAAACVLSPRLVPLPDWLSGPPSTVVRFYDRTGRFLAERRKGEEPVRDRIRLDSVDPLLVRATLAAEDRRFFLHPGVDPLALSRAVYHSLAHGEPLRGASTLTMQLVRLGRGSPRGITGRLAEVGWSLVLEAHLSKGQILEEYLNRAPYGGTIAGVGAASSRWFGKPPTVLSPGEAALLAALPRAPGRLHPELRPEEARTARNEVLRRMVRLAWLDRGGWERAAGSTIPLAPRVPARAPHFTDWVLRSLGGAAERAARVTTTLDPHAQSLAETALRRRTGELREAAVRGGAVVVLDARNGEILALVGSPDYSSPDAGQFNAALSARQPGSAVKPFTYAVAFAGALRPSSILADVPVTYDDPTGLFAPRNYAGSFSGPVSARMALANSWNVPTIEVVTRTGIDAVASGFRQVGLPCSEPDRLGLGITLGVGEVSLLELAAAYGCLARGGRWIEPRAVVEARDGDGGSLPLARPVERPALDPIACAWVTEILSDPSARAAAFGRGGPLEFAWPVAAKTGTSSEWRDAWTVLYTTRHVVAVWMGNPDGTPMDRITGVLGPALVASEILESIGGPASPDPFAEPPGIERRAVCPLSGEAAGSDCPHLDWQPFRETDPPLPPCRVHVARTIDTATGLLARPCTPTARIRRAVFVTLPARFAFWLADQRIDPPPEEGTDCLCGSGSCRPLGSADEAVVGAAEPFTILRPIDRAILAIDPTLAPGQQELVLEAQAPAGVEVLWRIDGRLLGETRGTHRLFWPLEPGTHRIDASIAGTRETVTRRVVVLQEEGEPIAVTLARDQ